AESARTSATVIWWTCFASPFARSAISWAVASSNAMRHFLSRHDGDAVQHEADVALLGDIVRLLAVDADAADVRQEQPRLGRDVRAHVPGVGQRVERLVRLLLHVLRPLLGRVDGRLDRLDPALAQEAQAVVDPLDVLLDRDRDVAEDGRAARAGDREQVG